MIEPSPSPSVSWIDPFNLLPDEIPPAPDWLLPVVLVLFCVVALGIAILLVMWGIARRKSAAVLAAGRSTTSSWVSLVDFDPKADPRRPKSPKVVREEPLDERKKRARKNPGKPGNKKSG
jgi:hypothetical protein